MKHENSNGSSRPALTMKTLIGGAAMAALMGLSFNAQAQTCVVSNWLGGAVGVTDADAGTQNTGATDNRRYGGPCGLRVPVTGAASFVTDDTPAAEGTYIARFYAFLDNAGGNPVVIFEGDDGSTAQVQVWYNFPGAGDLTLRTFDTGAGTNDITFGGIPSGWTSVEFAWEAAASAAIAFSVNGAADQTLVVDTSGITLANANLGNVNAATGGTSMDFDAFDSRRISRPGRLCRGLTDESRPTGPSGFQEINLSDAQAIFAEFASNGANAAGGIPDYDENGFVQLGDAQAVFARFASAQNSCDINS